MVSEFPEPVPKLLPILSIARDIRAPRPYSRVDVARLFVMLLDVALRRIQDERDVIVT